MNEFESPTCLANSDQATSLKTTTETTTIITTTTSTTTTSVVGMSQSVVSVPQTKTKEHVTRRLPHHILLHTHTHNDDDDYNTKVIKYTTILFIQPYIYR